ncbi:class I SAM-dependent methyltransferase [Streptomyces thermocoprophilus]|jgi:SAM-dependent methyltransferase
MAESFGEDPERYDRARPRYPEPLIGAIAHASPGPEVLDVGCGTGIAARQLRAAGCRVLGVEPDARMAELARRLGTPTEVAAFEDWEPAGRSFDALIAAQAWHWVDPVAGAAKAAQVLRPGGLLALFWNALQLPPELTEGFADACARALPDAPFDVRAAMTRPAAQTYGEGLERTSATLARAGGFGAPQRWRFDWERTYARDELLDQLPTFGVFTRLPADRMGQVLDEVGALVDAAGGSVPVRYATLAVAAVREGA